jgi:RecA-family ATPase
MVQQERAPLRSSFLRPWQLAGIALGISTHPGRSIYLSAEDDAEELHRRLDVIRKHYGLEWRDLAAIKLVDLVGQDAVLGQFDRSTNRIIATNLFASVEAIVAERMADLLVIDALADAFAGREIERQQARQFINLVRGLCRRCGVTALLLAHPSEAGLSSGSGKSGSTAWSNSVRSRLYFERRDEDDGGCEDRDARMLTRKKANYAPQDEQIAVRYADGVFIVDRDRQPLDKAARESLADAKFMALLDQGNGVGLKFSPNPSRTYAPTRFAHNPDAAGVTSREFEAAMHRLLKVGKIRIEVSGPPSKLRECLVLSQGAVSP